MKDDVEESCGKGVFESCILNDVTKLLGIQQMNINLARNVSVVLETVLEGLELVLQKQKAFLRQC